MADKINTSIVKIMRGEMKRLRLKIAAGAEYDCGFALRELADEAEDLMLAICDRVPDSAEKHEGAA